MRLVRLRDAKIVPAEPPPISPQTPSDKYSHMNGSPPPTSLLKLKPPLVSVTITRQPPRVARPPVSPSPHPPPVPQPLHRQYLATCLLLVPSPAPSKVSLSGGIVALQKIGGWPKTR